MPALSALGLLALTSGCGDLELPPAPDMSALVQAYRSPDGQLTTESAAELGKAMANNVVENQKSSPAEVVGEMVSDLQDVGGGPPPADSADANAGSGEQSVRGSRIDIAAIVRLHHICRGWGDTASTDESANGSLDLTATLDQAGMVPTIWGTLNGCRRNRGDYKVELDGSLRVHFGDGEPRVGLRYLADLAYLIEFEGSVSATTSDTPSPVNLHSHFQVFENREVRFLINLENGTRIIGIVDPATLAPNSTDPTISFATLEVDGLWSCTLNTQTRVGRCTNQTNPDEVVTW